jgi:small subunit ribosomal protein S9
MSNIENKKQNNLTSSIIVPLVDKSVLQADTNEVGVSKLDSRGRASATGRRKTSSARVWIKPGKGFTVNGKTFEGYFADSIIKEKVLGPIKISQIGNFEIFSTVKGGGTTGQAEALRHGIARALLNYDSSLRPILKSEKYLTRDSRKVERKKSGLRTARKPQQFSKR